MKTRRGKSGNSKFHNYGGTESISYYNRAARSIGNTRGVNGGTEFTLCEPVVKLVLHGGVVVALASRDSQARKALK